MNNHHLSTALLSLGALSIAVVLSACADDSDQNVDETEPVETDDNNDDIDDTDDPGDDDLAWIRAIHLSPDAPAVDIFVGDPDTPAVEDLSFPDGTDYLEVPAGSYDIWVSVAGTPSSEAVLEVAGLELAPGEAYSAAAVDYVTDLSALALADDADDLDDENVRFQVTHAAPGVPDVDIWAVLDSGAVELLSDVPFGATATLDDLPAAAYTLAFDLDDDGAGDVLFDVPELPGGTFANVFATNDQEGSVFLIAHLPDGATARIDAYLP